MVGLPQSTHAIQSVSTRNERGSIDPAALCKKRMIAGADDRSSGRRESIEPIRRVLKKLADDAILSIERRHERADADLVNATIANNGIADEAFVPDDKIWRGDLSDTPTERPNAAYLHRRDRVARIPRRDNPHVELGGFHERPHGLVDELLAVDDEPGALAFRGSGREHGCGEHGFA